MALSDKGIILLSAGGTGGHLFPAQALAHELRRRGWSIHLVTDARAAKYAGQFPADAIHEIAAATPSGKNPLAMVRVTWTLFTGFRQSRRLLQKLKPKAVIGFGGYPTVPPLAAASGAFPTMVHEQNAVMGRANRMLASRVTVIAGGFLKASGPQSAKIVETGNPVRQAVLEAAKTPYNAPDHTGPLKLVVFGGSQGARYFSDTVPAAVAALDDTLRSRLQIVQQARPEDEERVRARYEELGVRADVAAFFSDLPKRISDAHLVISRSGASTVLELAVIGRPAILVPLPHALDDDQGHNGAVLVDAGGAVMHREPNLDADKMAAELSALLGDPEKLAAMANGAESVTIPDAANLLADLTEAIAVGKTVDTFKSVHA